MDLFDAIEKRFSYRGEFTGAPVTRADLRRIVEAGILAPSGCNAQTTSFVIVDDPELLAQIGGIVDKPVVRTARAIVVCVTDPTPAFGTTSFQVEDCAAAVENMLLAITALGYATVWLDGVLRAEGKAEKIGELLGVPTEQTVRIILPIGVPKEAGQQPPRKPFDERARLNRM